MEHFNRMEMQGLVGSVRITKFEDTAIANISVATNYAYKTREGQPVMETLWMNVVAREGKTIAKPDSIKKGDWVHVVGRLRTRNFTDSEGNERMTYELIAAKLKKMDEDENVAS